MAARGTWHRSWVADADNARFVEATLERVRSEGAAAAIGFQDGEARARVLVELGRREDSAGASVRRWDAGYLEQGEFSEDI